jgi:hypothetical protein
MPAQYDAFPATGLTALLHQCAAPRHTFRAIAPHSKLPLDCRAFAALSRCRHKRSRGIVSRALTAVHSGLLRIGIDQF